MQATGYNMVATLEDGLLIIEGTNALGRHALDWNLTDRLRAAEAEATGPKDATTHGVAVAHIRRALAHPTTPIIPVGMIDGVTFRNANSLVNGKITVRVGDRTAQFHFRRKTRDDCKALYLELVRQIGASP